MKKALIAFILTTQLALASDYKPTTPKQITVHQFLQEAELGEGVGPQLLNKISQTTDDLNKQLQTKANKTWGKNPKYQQEQIILYPKSGGLHIWLKATKIPN